MKTEVEGHWSHDKEGKRIWIHAHGTEVNPRIHSRHLKKAEEELKEFKEKELRGRTRVRV